MLQRQVEQLIAEHMKPLLDRIAALEAPRPAERRAIGDDELDDLLCALIAPHSDTAARMRKDLEWLVASRETTHAEAVRCRRLLALLERASARYEGERAKERSDAASSRAEQLTIERAKRRPRVDEHAQRAFDGIDAAALDNLRLLRLLGKVARRLNGERGAVVALSAALWSDRMLALRGLLRDEPLHFSSGEWCFAALDLDGVRKLLPESVERVLAAEAEQIAFVTISDGGIETGLISRPPTFSDARLDDPQPHTWSL